MRTPPVRRRWLLLALAAAVLAIAAAGCGGGNDESSGTTAAPPATETEAPAATDTGAAPTTETTQEHLSLKLALDWFPNPDHVGLYEAQDKGYWTDQNLDVELKKPSDPSAGLKLVATNKFDLAIYYESEIYFAAEKGIPVITVGSLIPNPLNSMISLAGSKVTSPSTIGGSTIGQTGLPTDEAIIQTMEETEGTTDVKVVNVGFNLVPVLLSGKVDAIVGAYQNVEGIQIGLKTGETPNIIPLTEMGVPTFDELVIVANKERLASDSAYADAVGRFLKGMIEGTQQAIDNPEEATALMESAVQSADYTKEFLAKSVPATIDLLTPPGGTPVGCLNLDNWATYGKWMIDNKLLKAPIDVSEVATNDYNTACQ